MPAIVKFDGVADQCDSCSVNGIASQRPITIRATAAASNPKTNHHECKEDNGGYFIGDFDPQHWGQRERRPPVEDDHHSGSDRDPRTPGD